MDTGEVSLRPMGMSLRPGGGGNKNPFAGFGKGAGSALRTKLTSDLVSKPEKEAKKKPPGEIVRYTKDFLLKFSELCTQLPEELQNQQGEFLLKHDEEEGAAQRQLVQTTMAEETDERDWRARTAIDDLPQVEGRQQVDNRFKEKPQEQAQRQQQQQNNQQQQQQRPQQNGVAPEKASSTAPSKPSPPAAQPQQAAGGGAAPKIQKAADIGRTAWAVGSQAQGNDRAIKQVKGILNKLTPEKFERLLEQLLEVVTSAEILHATIATIFENAVAQPTFVAMYADLCERLSQRLPEFPPAPGEQGRMTFRRIMLNTCQDEFEGTAEARAALEGVAEEDRAFEERRVKQRTLGNIRLIAEMFKKGVVPEPVVLACLQDLLGDGKAQPVDDNIEAACDMLTIVGKRMEESPKGRPRMDAAFANLDRLSKAKAVPSRLRFLIRDLQDLRRSKWIPRREALQAKKLDEIRAEAHAELGMVPTQLMLPQLNLPQLPALAAAGPGADDVELFPAFHGGDVDWTAAGTKKDKLVGSKDKYSAFVGEYRPVPVPVVAPATRPEAAPAAATNATPPQSDAAPSYRKDFSEEERESRAKGLFTEYLSSADMKEALACVAELAAPGFLPKLVAAGVGQLLDSMKAKEHEMLTELLVALAKAGAYSADDLEAGLRTSSDQLEDLSLDVPLAGKLLGGVVGRGALEGVLQLDRLPELLKPIESAEPRREFAAEAFKYIKSKGSEQKLKELAEGASLKAGELLAADPELDPPDLPSVPEFLKSQGLSAVPI